MIYLDANVVAYAAENHQRYGSACKKILSAVEAKQLRVGASTLLVVEIMNVFRKMNPLLRKQKRKEINIVESVEALLSLPIVWFDLDLYVLERASRLVPRLLPADAVHSITAEIHGMREIISADKDFDGVAGLTRIDPLEWKD